MKSDQIATTISIVSLIVSIIGLGIAVWVWKKQDRQWKLTNMANVELDKPKFILSKKFTEEEVQKIGNWGYKVAFHRDDTDGMYSITSVLTAKDPKTNKDIPDFNPVFRLADAIEQLTKKGVKDAIIVKQYQVGFGFKNQGKTDALNLKVKILMENPISQQWEEVAFPNPTNLSPDIPIYITVEYNIALNQSHPENLKFKIYLTYNDIDQTSYSKEIMVIYNDTSNSWGYEKK